MRRTRQSFNRDIYIPYTYTIHSCFDSLFLVVFGKVSSSSSYYYHFIVIVLLYVNLGVVDDDGPDVMYGDDVNDDVVRPRNWYNYEFVVVVVVDDDEEEKDLDSFLGRLNKRIPSFSSDLKHGMVL